MAEFPKLMYPLHKFVEENALEEARCLAGVRELLEYSKSGVLGTTIAGASHLQAHLHAIMAVQS